MTDSTDDNKGLQFDRVGNASLDVLIDLHRLLPAATGPTLRSLAADSPASRSTSRDGLNPGGL
jgi:hypothetical protein